jgi:RHS repeat-associated protein
MSNRAFGAVTGWLGTAESGVGGGSGVKNLAFLYDEMGNVSQRQDNNLGLTENIYYDHDYRFSYSTLNSTQNLSVTYDGTGNITSRSDVASGATWTYSTTQKHAVTQAGSSAFQYVYDPNGNATSRQGSSIAWSSYNYPTTVNAGSGSTAETVGFAYGPDRARWLQTYSGNGTQETTDYVGSLLEVVTSGGVTDYRHYINAGGEHVAVYSRKSNGTNTFSYLLSDHQASVSSLTNSTGSQVAGESFTAFGNRRNPTTWSGPDSNSDLTTIAGITREGYTFQTALGLWMGMNHMNGRVEDSITGRMLSADPHIPDKSNTQAYNRYSYVYNNPVTFTDPTGWARCAASAGGAAKCFPNNPDDAGGRCLICMGYDPGSLGTMPWEEPSGIGSAQGITGFDANDSDLSTTGTALGLGQGVDQDVLTYAMSTGNWTEQDGQLALTNPNGTAAGLAATASLASYCSGKCTVAGFSASAFSSGVYGVTFSALSDSSIQVIAYEGTNSLSQLGADVVNFAGGASSQYVSGVDVALGAQANNPDGLTLLTGHSEGGGIAALASYVTGLPAITFNAAGVTPGNYGYSGGSFSQVTNYFSVTDPVSFLQTFIGPSAAGVQVPVMTLGGHSMSSLAAACTSSPGCGP